MPEQLIVVMDPFQEVDTPMEEGEQKQTPSRDETAPHTDENVEALKPDDNSDVKMNPKAVDILNLDTVGKMERLQDANHDKYKGDVKYNTKSFRSGLSVGYINVDISPLICSSLR